MIAHQATCVAIEGRGLLIEGPPGSGKSSLALMLIDRGACLVGDDSLMLEQRNGRVIAMPHVNTRGLIEVRNLGLVSLPVCDAVPVALVIMLDHQAPRFIEAPDLVDRVGVILPGVRLWPENPIQYLKAEHALARHGLPHSGTG